MRTASVRPHRRRRTSSWQGRHPPVVPGDRSHRLAFTERPVAQSRRRVYCLRWHTAPTNRARTRPCDCCWSFDLDVCPGGPCPPPYALPDLAPWTPPFTPPPPCAPSDPCPPPHRRPRARGRRAYTSPTTPSATSTGPRRPSAARPSTSTEAARRPSPPINHPCSTPFFRDASHYRSCLLPSPAYRTVLSTAW